MPSTALSMKAPVRFGAGAGAGAGAVLLPQPVINIDIANSEAIFKDKEICINSAPPQRAVTLHYDLFEYTLCNN